MPVMIGSEGRLPVVPGREAQAYLGGKTGRVCGGDGEERPGDAGEHETTEQRDAPGARGQVEHTLLLCRVEQPVRDLRGGEHRAGPGVCFRHWAVTSALK